MKNGIKAILNMTTYKLELPKNIVVVNMDISAKLQELNFWRINFEENGEGSCAGHGRLAAKNGIR